MLHRQFHLYIGTRSLCALHEIPSKTIYWKFCWKSTLMWSAWPRIKFQVKLNENDDNTFNENGILVKWKPTFSPRNNRKSYDAQFLLNILRLTFSNTNISSKRIFQAASRIWMSHYLKILGNIYIHNKQFKTFKIVDMVSSLEAPTACLWHEYTLFSLALSVSVWCALCAWNDCIYKIKSDAIAIFRSVN